MSGFSDVTDQGSRGRIAGCFKPALQISKGRFSRLHRSRQPSIPAEPSEDFLFSPICSRCYRLRLQRCRSCFLPGLQRFRTRYRSKKNPVRLLSGTSDVRHTSEISSSVLPMKKNLPFKSMSEIETTLQTDISWSSVFNFISATSGKTIRKTYGLTNRFLRKPINRNTDFCPPDYRIIRQPSERFMSEKRFSFSHNELVETGRPLAFLRKEITRRKHENLADYRMLIRIWKELS